MKKKKRFIVMTTTRMIMLGFLAAIVLGTILLSLPIATKERTVTPLVDALFTATTSITKVPLIMRMVIRTSPFSSSRL